MQEHVAESLEHSATLDERLTAAVQKRNRELADYFAHWAAAEGCANSIRQLVGDGGTGVEAAMATLARIEGSLDLIHGYFTELGRILRHNGDFDLDSYLCSVFERRIGNRQIRGIEDIPEQFHDNFGHLYGAEGQQAIDFPRDTESILADLARARQMLDELLDRPGDFSGYFPPPGKTPGSPELDGLREELASSWNAFLVAARATAYRF